MSDPADTRDGEYRATSDEMMEMLRQLQEVEGRKRQFEIGSEAFIAHAVEAERLSRLIFRWSELQTRLATLSPTARQKGEVSGRPIDEIASRPLDRILTDWRQAQLRFELATPGSPEAEQAASDVERLREEFAATQERLRSRTAQRDAGPGLEVRDTNLRRS